MKNIILVSLSNAMGMQLYCTEIANTLCLSYNVSIVVTKYFDVQYLNPNVSVYNFFTTKRPTLDIGLFNIIAYYKTLRLFKKADVVHYLNSHPSIILLEMFSHQKNTVFTLHDPIPHTDNLLGKCRALVDHLAVKFVNKGIIHSSMHKDAEIVKRYANKFVMTPLASKAKNPIYYPLKNYNKFLFFGRIEEYKGIDILINALEIIANKRNDFKCTIAGNGNFNDYYKLIKHPECFEIKNFTISEEEVQELFNDCTFCIMTYKSASQSGVIPLSYYHSRPVIVTNIDSLKEYVENKKTGFIVEKDIHFISQLIESILNNNYDLDKMAMNAFIYGNKNLSMESMTKDFIDIYFTD